MNALMDPANMTELGFTNEEDSGTAIGPVSAVSGIWGQTIGYWSFSYPQHCSRLGTQMVSSGRQGRLASAKLS